MRRRFLTLKALAFLLAVLLFMGLLGACGTATVVTTLEAVVAAAEAAVGALGATGQIPPPLAAQIENYLSAVDGAAAFASMELASGEPAGVQATKIVAAFAMIVGPDLPSGTAQAIVAAVGAVATAVQNFLKTIQPASAAAARTGPPAKLSSSDIAKLQSISARAATLKVKIQNMSLKKN